MKNETNTNFPPIVWYSHCISPSKTWDYRLRNVCKTTVENRITRNE